MSLKGTSQTNFHHYLFKCVFEINIDQNLSFYPGLINLWLDTQFLNVNIMSRDM